MNVNARAGVPTLFVQRYPLDTLQVRMYPQNFVTFSTAKLNLL